VEQLLEREGFPLDPFVQQMYLARCAAQLGEATTATNSWQRALEATRGDSQKLLQLGEFAEKNGTLDTADAAYNSAVAQIPKLRLAQQGRLRVAQAKRDTKQMHAVLAEMLKLWPNDTAVQNDEAYTRLLLTDSPPSQDGRARSPSAPNPQSGISGDLIAIEKLASELVRREPASLPHRTLLALALLKQGRPVSALKVYDGINVSPSALTPSALAVHAAVLAANGNVGDAGKEIEQVRANQLLPEEQQLAADLKK
jgi:tetratricopeptide (TPR) repeat protein